MLSAGRALLGLVFGDAYGLQYECVWPRPKLTWLSGEDMLFGCVDECDGRCCYSDDTEMAIALVECVDRVWNPPELAKCLMQRLEVERRVRYYGTYVKSLASYMRSGIDWGRAIELVNEELCVTDPSPAIRFVPLASAVPNPELVLQLAATQATSTHPCRNAVERTKLVAYVANLVSFEKLSVEAVLSEVASGSLRGLAQSIASEVLSVVDDPPYRVVEKLRAKMGSVTAVELGLVAAARSRNVVEAFARAVSLGGDVDTSAALACALAAARFGEPPRDLMARIEGIESIYLLAKLLGIRALRVMKAS